MIKPALRRSKWLAGLTLVTIAILLISGGCVANALPIISSLALTNEGEISPGGTDYIKCTATDPDNDELSYTWSASGGTLTGGGATIKWTAPDELGTYTVTVSVSDGDDIVTDQLEIPVVEPNEPPVIDSCTPEWQRLKKASNTPVTCVATDPNGDELSYEWSAVDGDGNPAGNFTGEGSTVTWVAPNNYGTYFISVTVSDGRGGEATATTNIIVCACGSAH